MTQFWHFWNTNNDFRDIILMTLSIAAFVLMWGVLGNGKIENIIIWWLFLSDSILSLLVFTGCNLELISNRRTLDQGVYVVCIFIFGFSVFVAAIMQDVNVIVASATLLLVVITAFSVNKTTDIAQKQLKFQNDPIVSLMIKENDVDVQIIDLIIENIGNGIAKNIRFDTSPHGFTTLSGDPIEQLYFFQHGIQILAPKQKYIIHLANMAHKHREIRERHKIPTSDAQLSPSDHQNLRIFLRTEMELEFTVHFENNEGEQNRSVFNFNLCVFWGLRFPQKHEIRHI